MLYLRLFFFCGLFTLIFSSCQSLLLDDTGKSIKNLYYANDSIINLSSQYIFVFGDIQEYTRYDSLCVFFDQSIDWILKQFNTGAQIRAILQTGDITNSNSDRQWERFSNSSSPLSSQIPFFTCVGNHDYSWDASKINDRNTTKINNWCHFEIADTLITSYYESNRLENYVAQLPLLNGLEDLQLLVLEYGTRDEVLCWADNYLTNHSNNRFILLTHEWLSSNNTRFCDEAQSKTQLSGCSSFNTPNNTWEKLVKKHNNIVCVLCGHALGIDMVLYSENDYCRWIPQILFNFQHIENGGNGLLQLWEFPERSNYIIIRTYNTISRNWYWSIPVITTIDLHIPNVSF